MKDLLKNYILKNPFSILTIIGIIIGLMPIIIYEKGYIVLWINHTIANSTYDHFFRYFTEIGNGLTLMTFIVIQALFSYKKAFQTSIIGILVFIVSTSLKFAFTMPRPTAFLPPEAFYHTIEGFEYARHLSFPSGHTMTAFAMFGIISFQCYSMSIRTLSFILAAAIGFSRMYLCQHFFIDIYIGALLGFGIVLIGIKYFSKVPYIPKGGLLRSRNVDLS